MGYSLTHINDNTTVRFFAQEAECGFARVDVVENRRMPDFQQPKASQNGSQLRFSRQKEGEV